MKIKKNLVHALPLAAIVGVSGLAFVGASVPASEQKASAADDGVISMNIDGDFVFEIVPEVGGAYDEKTIGVNVQTSNPTGYTLSMSTKGTESDAVSEENDDVIKSIDGVYTKTNMPINSWGYYVGNSNLNPIPVAPEIIANTDSATGSDGSTTSVTVGVKVAPSVKTGDYENAFVFTVLANSTDCGDGFYCIDTMQEMTPAICAATTTPLASAREISYIYTTDNTKIPRTILRDTRDNKTYLVSKYADGKCWMSQNLALDLSPSRTLTSEDTDLESGETWTPANATSTDIDAFGTDRDNPDDRSYKSSVKYLKDGDAPSETPSTSDGRSEWQAVGNYYNWIAATAGSGTEFFVSNGEEYSSVSNSICPKGWHLAYGGGYSSANGDLAKLADVYRYVYPFDEVLGFVPSGSIEYQYSISTYTLSDFNTDYYPRTNLWTSTVTEPYYDEVRTERIFSDQKSVSYMKYYEGAHVRCVANTASGSRSFSSK